MTNIKGSKVTLRAVEPSDIDHLYEWENDTDTWGISGTTTPFSHDTLAQFLEAQRYDIFAARQLRLMICDAASDTAVGTLDLFEFDPCNHRVGIGILIAKPFQRAGYATDALRTVEQYAANYLQVHQLWCNVEQDNHASIALFTSAGYEQTGIKRDWNFSTKGYQTELFFQRII